MKVKDNPIHLTIILLLMAGCVIGVVMAVIKYWL